MPINRDLFAGITFLAFGLFVFIAIPSQIPEGSGLQHGPRLFPLLVSAIMILSSLGVLYHELRVRKKIKDYSRNHEKKEEKRYWYVDLKELIRVGIIFAIMCVYIFILDKAGFIISSLLFAISILSFYKTRKWSYYVIVIGSILVIYLLFTYLLKIQLP